MKNFKYLLLSLFVTTMFISCDNGSTLIDDSEDDLSGGAITGGIVKLTNTLVGYVVGNDGTYSVAGTIFQGRDVTNTIDVYKTFSNVGGESSTTELLTTLTVGQTVGQDVPFSFLFKYEDLIQGLTLNGSPLPSNDGDLSIGDFWTLSFVSNTGNGDTLTNSATTKVGVGTRFAGTYNVIESAYWRIGVLRDDVSWPDQMVIESVDAITYKMTEYFGAFDGNEYFFQIDAGDNITYPAETPSGDPQTGNGQPMTNCNDNAGDLTNVPCGEGNNVVVRNDVTGADRLIMTFGYFTAGSGPREFYQVLEKAVD